MTGVRYIKKNKLLAAVVLAYLLLAFFNMGMAKTAVGKSMYYLKEMVEILPAVFVLTSLIEAWVPRQTIIRGFGENSGLRGNVMSLFVGSLSAGPIYAAFPIGRTLLQKGASIDNIIIILSSWAVLKVPMLLNEAKFLGLRFMAIRWVLTVVVIFTIAYLFKLFQSRGYLDPVEGAQEAKGNMITINKEYCVNCKACIREWPNIFKEVDGEIVVYGQASQEKYQRAIETCPVNGIKWTTVVQQKVK